MHLLVQMELLGITTTAKAIYCTQKHRFGSWSCTTTTNKLLLIWRDFDRQKVNQDHWMISLNWKFSRIISVLFRLFMYVWFVYVLCQIKNGKIVEYSAVLNRRQTEEIFFKTCLQACIRSHAELGTRRLSLCYASWIIIFSKILELPSSAISFCFPLKLDL